MASSKETYCLCGQPYNIGQFMIECDCCREWFHGSCVDVKIYQSDDIDKYHCPKCAQTYGPSVLKIPTNNHRADRYELGAESRAAQAGSPAWVRALAARPPRPLHNALQRMRGYQFTEEFVRDNGFSTPILFATPEGLEMKVPSASTFSARSVLRYCGAQLEVEVIDVRKQSTLRMPLGEFVDYFETPPETREEKVLNVISLEFSDTNMSPLVDPPLTARKLDWAERVWPATSRPPRPAVQKYCLMSAAGAYTDWHVDFGGTTVWYHVLRGGKIFYLAPPTSTNLALYQQWSASTNQNERFFGDMVEWYGTAELNAGETLVIPSGWLHAVLTPRDSLVMGGNLLNSYSIEMQLQVYEIERRVETPVMFRYPLFEAMHWYAGASLLVSLRRHNEESQDEDFTISEHEIQTPPAELPPLLLRGVKILANALKEWHALKSTDAAKRDNVPKCLNSGQLVRELCKELRTLEKRTSTANKDKDFKIRHQASPTKHTKRPAQKKSLKLTLPKPIMHMAHNNGEYPEEKLYEKPYIEKQEIPYQDPRYLQEIKYHDNGLQEAKTFIIDGKEIVLSDKNYMYQNFEEQLVYGQEANGFVETHDKKNGDSVLRIKMDSSPSSSREAPPPYTLPEHSILKSHLIGRPLPGERLPAPAHKQLQQWTISKKDIEMQEGYPEEQILFTNENLQANVHAQDIAYGPGMYSAEDIAPYQYVSDAGVKAAPAPAPPAPPPAAPAYPHYSYLLPRDTYSYEDQPTRQTVAAAAYSPAVAQQQPVGEFPHELPTYDAAIQHQYGTTNYVIEERVPAPAPRPAPAAPVRRSERPVRRRVSPTYDYEDGDLYIDEPAPRKPRQTKARRDQQRYSQPAVTTPSNYVPPAARPAPVNGIESLIQASVLAEEEPPTEPTETEDAAVAGMLSIGARYSPQRTFGLAARRPAPPRRRSTSGGSSKRQRKVTSASADEEDLEEDVIKEVHRDEEYVYPSLEMSSDEDEEWTASRRRNSRHRNDAKSKNDKDGLWSPRARLGRLVPRLRSGRAAPRQSVRQALLHARHHDVKRDTHTQQEMQNAKRAVIATKSRRPPPAPTPPPPNANNTRLKKGMKTAKQRLGKILKIHKMIY